MKVALTGATGFVGSHLLTALHKRGHDVMALVRNDAQAETVAAAGAMPRVVDLYDRPAVARAYSTTPKGRSIQPAPVMRRAQTSILRSSMRRSTPSPAPATPTSTSAVCGSTGTILPLARSPRSIRLRLWHGRNRLNAACSARKRCGGSSSCPAPPTATVAEELPGSSSVRRATTAET